MKISELIAALEKVKAEASDVEIYKRNEEFGGRGYEVEGIEKFTVQKSVHIAGTIWPNGQWKYADDYSYWEIR